MEAKIINMRDVCTRTRLSRSVIYQLIKRGRFPTAKKVFSSRVFWSVEEVDQWINAGLGIPPSPCKEDCGMEAKIINIRDVCTRTTLSHSVIYQLIKLGRFPAAKKVFSSHVFWNVEEVDQWIDERLNAKMGAKTVD